MTAHSILIVEDDQTFSLMLRTWLGKKGFQVETAGNVASARKLLSNRSFDLILSDLRLPDGDGLSLLSWKNEHGMSAPMIIMAGYADVQGAVQAMKEGACDYISKPIQPALLQNKIMEALEKDSHSASKPVKHEDKIPAPMIGSDFLEGKSDAARKLYEYAALVAPTQMSVLIEGASGTGKEYVAHRIHQLSKRSEKPFVAIDCGAVPKELAASEFFGHVKGSFTGALSDKIGAFVEANGGTLFLDEIGNLGYEVQVQLLRAIQERKVRPVGSTKEVDVDVRLICATNGNLRQAIAKGTFREDLYHRVNEFTLRMPSLSERKEDIMLFANLFLDQANRELSRNLVGFEPAAERALVGYSWPGNLRQLKNVVKRAALLARGKRIEWSDIAGELPEPENANSFLLHDAQEEKARIIDMLKKANNNKSKAAAMLGIDRKTLYNKLKQYGIS